VQRKQVVTLAAVDAIHGREQGSTTLHFNRYRDTVFKPGSHYLEVPYVQWSQWVNGTSKKEAPFLPPVPEGPGGHRGPLVMLTERGYLRFIMHFEDELFREICEYVLDTYFAAREVTA
jgi:hypothetical protein